MIRQIATIVAAAAVAQAKLDPEAVGVKAYERENCEGNPEIFETLFTGDCVTTKKHITVKDLNDSKFNVLKKSGDDTNEMYMFESVETCKAYGNKFNPDVEVAFIRAPGRGDCYPCKDCGTIKSVKFSDVHLHEKESTETKDMKVEDKGSASTTVASASALIVSAAVAMLF